MQKNFDNYSMQETLRLARSPAGQELLALLQREHASTMQAVQEYANAGQMEQAQQSLAGFMSDPRIKALLRQLQEESDG